MEHKKRVFTVLSVDSGGVRGIVSARLLQEIEERSGKPISKLFDMIGGTSTGAIVTAGLVLPDKKDPTKPRFTAKDVLRFYHETAAKIFPEMRFKSLRRLNGSLYDPKPLEDGLAENFGDTKMKDALTSFLIPATDIKDFKPVWITHIKGQKDTSKEGWSTMLMRDAVRATTTVPTYFPAKYVETTPNEQMPNVKHRHALIDGAFFAGNSMHHLLSEAKKVAPPDAEIIIVHIGTGSIEHSLSPEELNNLGPLGLVNPANGSILLSLFINMTTNDVKNDMKNQYGDRFFSFDGAIDPETNANSPSLSLDDAREENLARLEKFAEQIIKDNSVELDRLCSILKGRELAEEHYLESQAAMQQLTKNMADTTTVKSLMQTYSKIVRFSSDLGSTASTPEETEVRELANKLNEHHKTELDRIYRVLLDKKQHQSKILNSFREARDDITKITKKLFGDTPKKALPPPPPPPPAPPANDDVKPPAPQMGGFFRRKKPKL